MQLIWLHDMVTRPRGIYNHEAQGQSDCNPIHPDGSKSVLTNKTES